MCSIQRRASWFRTVWESQGGVSLYSITWFNNSLDVTKCILNKKLVKLEVPTLEEDYTAHDKRVLEYRMGELMETERVPVENLSNLFVLI